MILTRYTFEGNGIFRALQKKFNEVDMSVADEQELFDAEEAFERNMEIPDICSDKNIDTRSYFTEAGLKHFKEELDTICYYADLYLHKPVQVETIDYTGNILYQDYLQAVIPA